MQLLLFAVWCIVLLVGVWDLFSFFVLEDKFRKSVKKERTERNLLEKKGRSLLSYGILSFFPA